MATNDYFAVLGVGRDVSQDDLEARYRELSDYLASPAIPTHLRQWAAEQAALVDEAYAVLSDPEQRLAVRSRPVAPAGAAPQPTAADGQARAGATRDSSSAAERARTGRSTAEPAVPERRSGPRPGPLVLGVLIGLAALGGAVLARYGVPGLGQAKARPTPTATGAAAAFDTKRVADLMAVVQRDPSNKDALFELGETFFTANQWEPAITWFSKLVAIDPNNAHARTDIGTANFNLGRFDEAKQSWLAVLQIDPNDVQAHYNLGFLYANVEPQDLPAARNEWQKVIELAPGSSLAKTAQVHMDALAKGTATPTPTATPGR